jgi:hypothetical protein
MTQIDVTRVDGGFYEVTLTEGSTSSQHEVTVQPADIERFGGGATAESLVAASFRFLLEREPKESILGKFDLSVITRYFPEYADRIGGYL